MPSGGKRPGAGRPSKLSFAEKIEIGQDYETRLRAAGDTARRTAVAEGTKTQRVEWDKLKAKPLHLRDDFVNKDHAAFEPHEEDLEFSRETDQGVRFGQSAELVTFDGIPPRGTSMRILREVAEDWTVSEDVVRDCVKRYRALEASLKE